MQNAVAAGLRVTTAQHDITVDNFTGLGYLLEDPETGAAAYLISGGRNGGNSPSGQNIYPLPQIPAIPIFGLMVGASLRSAGASLVAESGVITGMPVWRMIRMVDLPWQSTNKRSLETVMFHNIYWPA